MLTRLYAPLSERLAEDRYCHRAKAGASRPATSRATRVGRPRGGAHPPRTPWPLPGAWVAVRRCEVDLVGAWETGTPEEAAAAVRRFIDRHNLGAASSFLLPSVAVADFAAWLFDTSHIHVGYGLRFDGTDIVHLSPGTRGIVLLTLYLSIDRSDTRPLIIDQPEENLDPQSVFNELVGYFRVARTRRQVIVVTHNANLVVNTDADQVIVASSTRVPGQALPQISYVAGALEDPDTRRRVCDILEGGEEAFRQRDRKYQLGRPASPVRSDPTSRK